MKFSVMPQLQCLHSFAISTLVLICSPASPGSWLGQLTLDDGCAGYVYLVLETAGRLAFFADKLLLVLATWFSVFFGLKFFFVGIICSFLFSLDDSFHIKFVLLKCHLYCFYLYKHLHCLILLKFLIGPL